MGGCTRWGAVPGGGLYQVGDCTRGGGVFQVGGLYQVVGCTRWGAVPGGGLYQVGDCIPYIEANKIKKKQIKIIGTAPHPATWYIFD